MQISKINTNAWLVSTTVGAHLLTKNAGMYRLKSTFSDIRGDSSLIKMLIKTQLPRKVNKPNTNKFMHGIPLKRNNVVMLLDDHWSGLPLFKKSKYSNVIYCAGFYTFVKDGVKHIVNECKLNTLYDVVFYGPFKSKQDTIRFNKSIKTKKTDKYHICFNGLNDMARPKPTVLLEKSDSATYKTEQVLESEGIYAVFYKGEPINLRTVQTLVSYPGPKYKRCSFSNAGFAVNLAESLNTMYNTTEFKVYKLTTGEEYVGGNTNDQSLPDSGS